MKNKAERSRVRCVSPGLGIMANARKYSLLFRKTGK
jgi:hypothetical protein